MSTGQMVGRPSEANLSARVVTATGSTTARSLGERAVDFLWAEDEGARGDGSDDTAAIQAALNKGKPVRLRAGRTYSVTGLAAVAGGALIADGPGATLSLAVGGTKALTIAVANFRVVGVRFNGGNAGPYNNGAAVAGTRYGIFVEGAVGALHGVTISDCYATGFDHSGFYIAQTAQASGGDPGLPAVNVIGCSAWTNYVGFNLPTQGEYVQITNCHSGYAWAGIYVIGANTRVVNSHFSKCYRNALVRAGGVNSDHGGFFACSFNHSVNLGWGLDAGNVDTGMLFVGCFFWYAGIAITASHGVVITGSQIGQTAITTSGTSTGTNYIVGNWLFGTVTRTFAATLPLIWRDNVFDGQLAISADRGDAGATLSVGTDSEIQRWATTLTANRAIALSTTGAPAGAKFRVVRTGLGAFTLDVGGLKTIPNSTAAWVDVMFDGTAWVLVGYGTL